MELTYGSVCSGIEAATIAWHPLGWKPLWFSQFDPEHNYKNGPDFPSRVLAHHYPEVMNLGNMLDIEPMIRAGMVEAPDVLVGGTPCQAFSVAGLRDSLNDARGQLTLHYVTLANTIDEVRTADGKEPSIIVWENVPGVLNTPDDAFGCFIGALAGEPDKLYPPTDKRGKPLRWPDAGCVVGAGRTVAWRILDAQYFGLAQRRRRVFVVASAREGFHPAQVLLEFDGVFRDSPPSRETGEKVTGDAAPGVRVGSHWDGDGVAHPTLGQSFNTGGIGQSNQELFSQRGCGLNQSAARMVAFGEYVEDETASTMKSRDYKDATDLVASYTEPQAYSFDSTSSNSMKSANPDSATPAVGICKTLDTSRGLDPSCNQGGITVIALAGNTIGRAEHNGGNGTGFCETGECYTLTKTDVHGVAISFEPGIAAPTFGNSSNAHGIGYSEEHTPPLRAGSSGTNMTPTIAYGLTTEQTPKFNGECALTRTKQIQCVAFAQNTRDEVREMDVVGALAAQPGMKQTSYVRQQMQVRRLTPRECERLQGFKDDYSLIPGDTPISKVRREKLDMDYVKYLHRGGRLTFEQCMNAAADGPRYKSLGNSMATPVMHWIGQRIERALAEPWPELIP